MDRDSICFGSPSYLHTFSDNDNNHNGIDADQDIVSKVYPEVLLKQNMLKYVYFCQKLLVREINNLRSMII